jgi:DNA helicase-2/ATP-dependent DNA helicase PcrA
LYKEAWPYAEFYCIFIMTSLNDTPPYNQLNTEQFRAVTAALGPLLVLAGAGSGKTKVLVSRIAYIIQQHQASPYRILAVTFTNKAANEMKDRLQELLGEIRLGSLWMGTFHGLSYRLLRAHSEAAGLSPHFQVLDSDDQLRLIRRSCKLLNITDEQTEAKQFQSFINRKKDDGIRVSSLTLSPSSNIFEKTAIAVYQKYEQLCKENHRIDFADILLLSYELLQKNPVLLQSYQEKFQHVLVDEFQDTNTIQYAWLKLLAGKAQSVMMVGDDDQSIYGWRGAKIENMQRFPKDFPNTEMVRLEQNYRSTKTILAAANTVIANNAQRLGKALWTDGIQGERIQQYEAFNEEDEALYVIRKTREWIAQGHDPKTIAILFRSNAQSRVLEEAFLRSGIAYAIYGGLRFFERAEIKDALCYARLVLNPHDNAAFERVINVPNRGIGHKSFEKIRHVAENLGSSYWQAAKQLYTHGGLLGKASVGLAQFVELIEEAQQADTHQPLSGLLQTLITQSGLLSFYAEQKSEQAQNRVENLQELINACHDFSLNHPLLTESVHNGEQINLSVLDLLRDFMAYASLEGNEARKNPSNAVQLMTLHAAKGLEFPLVFICGMEEGLFPSHFSRGTPSGIEEERRLCYVGITRAMQILHMTFAKRRRLFGKEEERRPSGFLTEIPPTLIEKQTYPVYTKRATYGDSTYHKSNPPKKENAPANQWIIHWNKTTQMRTTTEKPIKIAPVKPEHALMGKRMKHPKFGPGLVLDQEGSGDNARIHIHFDHYGNKWLSLSYAKLEPITEDIIPS